MNFCILTLGVLLNNICIWSSSKLDSITSIPYLSPILLNILINDINDYQDVEVHGFYKDLVIDKKVMSEKDFIKACNQEARDNNRTPMQWDDKANAGFTTGKPWFALNPNYTHINAQAQVDDKDSVFAYYQKLIELRHNSDLIVYGDYELLDPDDDEIFAYKRRYNDETLLVISNFTKEEVTRDYGQSKGRLLIGNYEDDKNTTIRPYESKVYLFK